MKKNKSYRKKEQESYGNSERISYSDEVSENEEKKFNRILIIYIYNQHSLNTLKKEEKQTHRKPNLLYLVQWLNPQ